MSSISLDRSSKTVNQGDTLPGLKRSPPSGDGSSRSTQGSDFKAVLEAATQYGIPSVHIGHVGIGEGKNEALVLGSGMTAQVVQHVTDDTTEMVVPPNSTVALKIFRLRRSDGQSARTARQNVYDNILREIKAFCHSSFSGHPNIVRLLFVGWRMDDPLPVLAMELGTHGSLDHVIKESGPGLSNSQKQHVTVDIALGLFAIHHAGFLHGDLKPDNIIILGHSDPDRQVIAKLTDFGGSLQATDQATGKPVHMTPLWCAPEVLNKDSDIDWKKADVYSYGLIVGSIWARADAGFGFGRLEQPSSSFLAAFIPISMEERDINDLLWCLKGDNTIVSALSERLARLGVDDDELLDMLTSTLQSHFWMRPDTDSLTHKLTSLAARIGRNMHAEKDATLRGYDRLSADASQPLRWLTGTTSFTYLAIVIRQLELELRELDESIEYVPITDDIPDQFPEGLSSVDFVRVLKKFMLRALSGGSKDVAAKGHVSYGLGLVKLLEPGLSLDREKGIEYMRAGALHGNGPAIFDATLMLEGTHLESNYPVRFYLTLLAFSHSNRAMQILSVRWPSLWNIIRKFIREMSFAYVQAGGEVSPGSNDFLASRFALYLRHRQPLERQLTLHESLTFGAVEEVEKALNGSILVSDWDETLPGLLHKLSFLPDAEASSFARVAYEKGARLDFFAPSESPIMEGGKGLGHLQASCSPLSSAIRRGKPTLALAIFCIHIEFDAPIPDLFRALQLSFALLYHEISEILLQLLYQNPEMCQNGPNNSTAMGVNLHQIMSVTPSSTKITDAELERRALHGGQYDSAYAKTLQVILAEGFDPTEGSIDTCPLFLAFRHDDVVGARTYVQHIQSRGLDVVARLNNPGNTSERNDITALSMCIFYGSLRCFEFLLKEYPQLLTMNDQVSDTGILQEACSDQTDTRFISLLLEAGCDVITGDRGHVTPLHAALRHMNIAAADIIASHCSDEQLRTLLGRDLTTGWSIFSYLLFFRYDCKGQQMFPPPRLIASFQWLADHAGTHFSGPRDDPCFKFIIGKARPSSRNDQILDLELFGFLLELYYNKMKSKRWESSIVHSASSNGHVEIVKLLISQGFDVDACSDATQFPPELNTAEGFTALDLISLLTARPAMPINIRQGPLHGIKEWIADMEEIKSLLAAKTKHSKASRVEKLYCYLKRVDELMLNGGIDKIHEVLRLDDTRRVKFNDFNTQLLSREPPSWPVPVPSHQNDSPTESALPPLDSQDAAEFWTRMVSGTERHQRRNNTGKKEEQVNAGFLQQNRRTARERKQRWRLPPDWDFIGFIKIKEDYGQWRTLFQDCKSGDLTFQKPELYRGEKVALSTSRSLPPALPQRTPTLRLRETEDCVIETHTSLDWHKIQKLIQPLRIFGMKTRRIPAESALDYVDDKGNTPLHIYARLGVTEGLKAFIQAISDIECENNSGLTALQVAVACNRLEVVRILLDHGAQSERLDATTGLLPLHISTLNRAPDVARLLLKAGANPDGESVEGIPVIHFCLSNCDSAEMVQVLIDGGADVNLLVGTDTPLSLAVANSREDSLKALLSAGAAMNATRDPEDDESLLHIAAQEGSMGIAEILLDHGADINRRDRSLKTPIIDAILCGQRDMIQFFCSRGVDPSVIPEFQFFRRTREDKIEQLFIHVGDGERVSPERLEEGEGDQYGGWEEWEPVTVTEAEQGTTE